MIALLQKHMALSLPASRKLSHEIVKWTEIAFDKGLQDSRFSGARLIVFIRMGISDVTLYYVIAIADSKPICSFSMHCKPSHALHF